MNKKLLIYSFFFCIFTSFFYFVNSVNQYDFRKAVLYCSVGVVLIGITIWIASFWNDDKIKGTKSSLFESEHEKIAKLAKDLDDVVDNDKD